MAVTTVESGTQSATGAHDLGSGTTTAGVYVCEWNLTAMVNADVVRCVVKTKTLTGDTIEEIYSGSYANLNGGGDPVVSSPPVVSMFSVRCAVERVSGASPISIPWSLISIT